MGEIPTNFPSSLDAFTRPGSGNSRSASPTETASFDNVMDSIEALEAKVGVNGSADAASLDRKVNDLLLPWLIDVDVFMTAIQQTNWDTLSDSPIAYGSLKYNPGGAQNDAIAFDLVLAAGTWTVEVMYAKASNAGIMTLDLGAGSIGTIDGYSAVTTYDNRTAIAAVVIPTTGKKRLTLTMATKNGSASAYIGYLQHIQLRRTA